MKPYKSIFKESLNDIVNSEVEAKQIVDISKLEWYSRSFKSSNWETASSKCPKGWRLPTIQELYTAYIKGVKGFKGSVYWSSSEQNTGYAWSIFYNLGILYNSDKREYGNSIRCVRDI